MSPADLIRGSDGARLPARDARVKPVHDKVFEWRSDVFVGQKFNHKGTKDTKKEFIAEFAEKRGGRRGKKTRRFAPQFVLHSLRFSAPSAVTFLFVSFVSLWLIGR
jgi:hypothetical protein